ncbi:MAG: DapH/DapD/GlmU-related protein [Vampirovibrionales bacterium]|nr:DapH/DapD/GlmU-related protein [Vampirovibrionales bacterium]
MTQTKLSVLRKELSVLLTHWLLRLSDYLLANGGLGRRFRANLLRSLGVQMGKNCKVGTGFYLHTLSEPLTVGEGTGFNCNVHLDATAPITIGNHCNIGFNTQFITANHTLISDYTRSRPAYPGGRITIEDFVWIGAGSTLLPGVTIGRGSVVAAGSLVTKDIPPNVLAMGRPAKVIKPLTQTEDNPAQAAGRAT